MATVTSHQPTPIQQTGQTLHRHRSFHYDQRHSNHNNTTNSNTRQQVQHVGNYIIYKKTLGSGSMGTVKLAECLSDKDHQLYAVKIMPKINLNTPVAVGEDNKQKDPKDTPREREQRTIREMAIMHLLRHPNICQLKEWVVQGDHYYMFLEYVQGGQLLDYIISHGKLKEKLARKFARQIVSALDYCHRNSIVHRDLKIENILITNNEEIKIIDFGLSNIYSPVRLLNTFCGSLYFAAPELLQAKYYTGPEVDVWSFAVVLYVLVCGRVPFDDTSLPALHKKIKAGHVDYPDHLSKDCVDLLSKLLVVDPTKRETLSFAIHHPWMNKGYDESIYNYLPHRQPLTSIDPHVVQGMQGFGLGTPEEIEKKLLHIISSPEYQYAAAQVDQNYQPPPHSEPNHHHLDHNNNTNTNTNYTPSMTRWRRNLSIRRTQASMNTKKNDDPQHLPAMYDPLISIYTLVKERKEFDEKMKFLESEGYSPVQLGRSASTSLSKSSTRNNESANLHRRKTERVPPSHHRPPPQTTTDWADPTTRHVSQQQGATILQRSKSAAKRFMRTAPTNSKELVASSDEHLHVIDDHRLLHQMMTSSTTQVVSNLKYSSSLKKKTMNLLRSSSLSDKRHRQQHQPKTATTEEDSPKISTQPKSLFDFSRRHLFKVSSSEMLRYVQEVLLKIGVRYMLQGPFTLKCELSDWSRYEDDEGLEHSGEPVQFTLMVYQARWAGGRLGVKIMEAEDGDKLYRHIHHTILNELGTLLHK